MIAADVWLMLFVVLLVVWAVSVTVALTPRAVTEADDIDAWDNGRITP
jgi:hypothetical protein